MTQTQLRSSMAIAIFASLYTVSCSDKGLSTGGKKTCTQGGTTVEVGQSVPSGDGCNSCICQPDSSFACTSKDCPPDAASDASADLSSNQVCVDGGKTYAIGDSFKKDCNTCTCTMNGIACTLMACPPPGGTGGTIVGTGGNRGTGGAIVGTGGNRGTGGAIAGTGGTGGGLGGSSTASGGAGGNRGSGGRPATGGALSTVDAAPQGCIENGHTYALGESFNRDCNTCSCTASGIVCTEKACSIDARLSGSDGSSGCVLSANLTFGEDGGNALYWDSNRLTTSTFTITRAYSGRSDRDGSNTSTCSPALPVCSAPGAVTVATINADLADSDVQALWSLPQNPVPLFGTDARPVDGTVYSIALDDGRKVFVGGQCASPSMSSCRYIPAGLVRLTQDLRRLATSMLADPVCKGL